MKSRAEQIEQLLERYAEEIETGWIGAAIEAAALVQESEWHWHRYMELFVANLRQHGIEPRPEIIASKQQAFVAWQFRRDVFLEHLKANPSLRLCRFDGGEENPCGYVLLDRGKPRLALTVRINRPDPNIGDLRLPFP